METLYHWQPTVFMACCDMEAERSRKIGANMAGTEKQRIKDIEHVASSLTPKRYKIKVVIWKITVTTVKQVKRIFDFLSSLILLTILSPLFALTGIAIYLEDPGPIFYTQDRVGKDGLVFKFYKFRSMVVNADTIKEKLSHLNESDDGVIFKMKKDPRITKTGKFIRKFSIDELPQLFNVLIGNMSLVGPRPGLPAEVSQYTLEQRKRLHAIPGITCIWQVSGRSDIPFAGQVRLDIDYIQSTSLKKDLIILARTIPAVLSGKGAY